MHVGKDTCEQDESILVVGIHVLHDPSCSIGQRVWLSLLILRGSHPAHHAKAADVVNVYDIHAVEREVLKVHPVFTILVTGKVKPACLRQFWSFDSQDVSQKRNTGCPEYITPGIVLHNQKRCARICWKVL